MGVLGKNYLHTVATNIILKLIIGLAISIITARALGPGGRGEYNLIVLIITTLTTLLNFGVPSSNTFFVAQKKIQKEKLFRASFFIALIVSLFSFLLLYGLFRFQILNYFFPVAKLSLSIILSLGIIPIVFFNLFAQGIIVGENKIYLNNYVYLASQSVFAIALGASYVLGVLTVQLTIVLFAFSNVVAFGIIAVSYRHVIFSIASGKMSWTEYKQLFGFSTQLQLGTVIQFLNYRLDAFLVNMFLGTVSVGLYVMAVNLVEILWLLSTSMASVLLPTVAASHERSTTITVKAAFGSFSVTLIAGLIGLFIAPWLIVFLFGKAFAPSAAPFLILLPGIIIFSITNVLAAYMTGIGKPGFNVGISFVTLIFTVVFDIILIPRLGIAGAAIASSVSYITQSLLTLIIFLKLANVTLRECSTFILSIKNDFRSIGSRARLMLQSFVP